VLNYHLGKHFQLCIKPMRWNVGGALMKPAGALLEVQ
jgi:hypothetical protein